MLQRLKALKKAGQETMPVCDGWKLCGYSEDVDDVTVNRRIADFNEWLESEHGLVLASTRHRRLYSADEVADYRRKDRGVPREKKHPVVPNVPKRYKND
jgi:hypothetical protein